MTLRLRLAALLAALFAFALPAAADSNFNEAQKKEIEQVVRDYLPRKDMLSYLDAVLRVYNRYGRRDNAYKAWIKIMVKAEGLKFFDAVNDEFTAILERDRDGANR